MRWLQVDLKWKYEPAQKRGSGAAKRSGEEESGSGSGSGSEEEENDGPPQFPVTCQICEKILFTPETAELHMKSKKHKKNEEIFYKNEKKSKRTPEQIERLKARNKRKREKKMGKKGGGDGDGDKPRHVWGEHKLPPKKSTGKKTAGKKAEEDGKQQAGGEKRKSEGGGMPKTKAKSLDEMIQGRLKKKKITVD